MGRGRLLFKSGNLLVNETCVSKLASLGVPIISILGRSFAAKAKTKAPNSSSRKGQGPVSAYNIFVKESGPGLLAGRSTSSVGERARIYAEAWKQTSAEERARLAEKLEGSRKAAAPRRSPRSAWHVFLHEAGPGIVAQRPDLTSLPDRARAIGEAWRGLPDAGKQEYHDKFNHFAGKH